MKVLMFGWEFPPHITGGLGTACYGMTKGLLKQGAEVFFVVPKAYGDEDQRAVRLVNASDVPINIEDKEFLEFTKNLTYVEVGSNLVPYLDPEEFEKLATETKTERQLRQKSVFARKYEFAGAYGKNLMEEISRYALVAAEVAKQYEFDVIHAHDWLTYYAGIAAKKISGKPLVAHIHATEFDRTGDNVNTIIYDIERTGLAAADRVIAVSNLTRNVVIERYGINPDKVFTVHNAIEPVEKPESVMNAKKAVKEKVVTFLGRITFQKGPEYFIEAAHQILQRDRNVRFVMAGSGDMLNKMIRRVAQLKIADRFHFTGFLKGEAVDRMFALSDVFVMPSVSEPFGLVPLEAMRTNVPVIVSKQSGVAEILKHAIKIDFWDVHGMADAIWGLLHYDGLTETFVKYGKDEVDSLKWEHAAVKIMEVYRDAVNHR
ncbi:MAG TPA: glycosyltransferase family 4 protein [Bacteroidales bacterium]|nr:glycosyltransferase family 4 protein [Bacteroidales bacterium]